ncbi:hypothetical protein AC578_4112 [Pseudocercospora eumusae]|uniref:Uncharacterized protein n=1 Tax=Pseudocercospora eumusae TaxID=321146 RepID=A0A139HFC1_9PEZI|nr:hypothetical protein AC578_4112 [Pseudocercospora eumusae]
MPARTRSHGSKKHDKHDDHSDDDYEVEVENLDDDSDEDDEDYIKLFGGRSKQEIIDGKRFDWSPLKPKIVKHAIRNGYSAQGSPTVQEVIDLIEIIGLPLFAGKRIAQICIKKLLDTIKATIAEKSLPGLIRIQDDGVVRVSAALVETVKRSDFSAMHLGKRGIEAMQDLHAEKGHCFRTAKPRPRVSEDRICKQVMQKLVVGKLITKENVVERMACAQDFEAEAEEEEEKSVPVKKPQRSSVAVPRAKRVVSLPKHVTEPAPPVTPPAPAKKFRTVPQGQKKAVKKTTLSPSLYVAAAIPIELPKALLPAWQRLSISDRQNFTNLVVNMRDCGVSDDSIIDVVEKKLRDVEEGIEPGQSKARTVIKEEEGISSGAEISDAGSERVLSDVESGGDASEQNSDAEVSDDGTGRVCSDVESSSDLVEQDSDTEACDGGSGRISSDVESGSDVAELESDADINEDSSESAAAALEAFMKANNFTQEGLSRLLFQQQKNDRASTNPVANREKKKKKQSKAQSPAHADKPTSSPSEFSAAQEAKEKKVRQSRAKESHVAAEECAKSAKDGKSAKTAKPAKDEKSAKTAKPAKSAKLTKSAKPAKTAKKATVETSPSQKKVRILEAAIRD